ncbi:ras and Rab interactor 2 isoform X3 [Sorex araneus]|uniref:ras and Rab interactor 2 isoform X3 n=1 Tax=Sorex araneus TaxID=42254 RepID=UPI002433A779|nr:ras and Rab interactor 2 isoform X3 [Sorex araneus]
MGLELLLQCEGEIYEAASVCKAWAGSCRVEASSMVRHKDDGCSEEKDVKTCPRDSGYDSLSNRLSILDRLLHTHPIWLQLSLSEEEAAEVLKSQPPGIFLVRKSTKMQKKVLSLRLPCEFGSPLKEFTIKESTYTFSLEGSGISFADLFRLVAFYCISRDVLPFTLKLPYAISTATTEAQLEELAQLGLNFWSSPADNNPPNPPPPHRPVSGAVRPAARQLCLVHGLHGLRTRAPAALERGRGGGALCFVNPLFLEVHSRDLPGGPHGPAPRPPPPRPPPPAGPGCTPETPAGLPGTPAGAPGTPAGLPETPDGLPETPAGAPGTPAGLPETPAGLPETPAGLPETPAGLPGTAGPRARGDAPGSRAPPVPPPRLKKQASFLEAEGGARAPAEARPRAGTAGSAGGAPPAAEAGPGPRPPWHGGGQRLSDMSISTSSSDSLDLERSMPLFGYEGDTASSPEDYDGESDQETMAPPIKSKKKRNSSFVLPRLVKSQLRKVSGVFSSFMTPEKRMVRRIAELSRDKCTYFGCLVQDYVSFLQENKECHVSSTDLLQTIRQFMTQVKNYLSQSSELDPPIESLIPEDQIDVVLEKAMHKCILKPLKGHVEAMLKDFHVADGSWKQLKENLQLVRQRNPQELGVFAPTPDFVDVEKIKVKFMTMQKMYSPEKKVMLLLRVCKLIYTVMENNSGRMYGADDFLPVLTYVIAQCDMLELDTEIEYMMELLDPSLLHGEGGYYLTSAYGALSLIKNFQEEQAARLLSSEARDTLRQWHKRRTTNRTVPSVDDFQNYLRVAFQEVSSGCTGKTLLVRPYVTTEDVCQLCAEKFKVEDPQEYSLFLFVDETWQQLAEDTYPQKIKAELHSRPQPHIFHFVYKRIKSDPYGVIFQNGEEDLTTS